MSTGYARHGESGSVAESGLMPWNRVTDEWNRLSGQNITRTRVCQIAEAAQAKIAAALKGEPPPRIRRRPDAPPQTPPWMKGDKPRTRAVILHLLRTFGPTAHARLRSMTAGELGRRNDGGWGYYFRGRITELHNRGFLTNNGRVEKIGGGVWSATDKEGDGRELGPGERSR